MKKFLWLAIVAQFAFSLYATDTLILEERANNGDAYAAFNLAELYEIQGDHLLAMEWYKKASSIALGKIPKSKFLEEGLLKNKVAKIERTQEIYGSVLSAYENDPKAYNSVAQMMSKVFDMKPYKINYLLPATYDNASTQDRQNFETKFQISFQKDLIDNFFGLHETLVLGYTQTSWWQTGKKSTPFRETNYQPEIFMVMPHFDKESFIKAYQFGLLHESNGLDIPKSRSWNRLYAKAYLQLGGLFVSPRIWYRLPENSNTDDNPNIDDYLGYGDLEFVYPWGSHTFKLLARHNMHFTQDSRGAVQFDWTFPLWDDGLFGYIQLYSGYGESLIDYNQRSDRIGLGFALTR